MEMTDRFKAMCNDVEKIDSLARNIRYFNVMFGNKNNQRNDYAEIQLIFARWRTNLPVHYKPLIDFYQEKIDEIAPMIEKLTLAECVSSYNVQ